MCLSLLLRGHRALFGARDILETAQIVERFPLCQALEEVRARNEPATRVITSDALGLPAEAKEATAFAILAYETWHGRPGNLPAATGARRQVVLGSITPGCTGERPTWREENAVGH